MKAKKEQACSMCKQVLPIEYFYRKKNLDGTLGNYLTTCKQCLCLHVDDTDPNTFLWIIKDLNIPYIPNEWKRMVKYRKEQHSYKQTFTLSRYISKMKLPAYKNFQWEDTAKWFGPVIDYIEE